MKWRRQGLRGSVLLGLLGGFGSMVAALADAEGYRRPNLVIINADDLSPEHLGCYGAPGNPTPRIDELARKGVRFETCWATPLCAPSRAMLVTGRYAYRTGVWHNALQLDGSVESLGRRHPTFASLLQRAGYATAMAGKKMEIGGRLGTPAAGFEEFSFHEPFAQQPESASFSGAWETDKPMGGYARAVTSRYWNPCVVTNGKLVATGPSDFGEDIAVDFLDDFMRRNADRPFLVYYSMNLPHGTATGELPSVPSEGTPGSNRGGNFEQCVRYIDILVGRIVDAIRARGLEQSTTFIFTSDNGDARDGKTRAIERGARVPLVIAGAGVRARGRSDALVSYADIFPTVLELGGTRLDPGYAVDGMSLVPVLDGRERKHREWLYSYIGTARLIRDAEWLLEAVDRARGQPDGRLYRLTSSGEQQLVRPPFQPEEARAHQRLIGLLAEIPDIDFTAAENQSALEKYSKNPFVHKLERAGSE